MLFTDPEMHSKKKKMTKGQRARSAALATKEKSTVGRALSLVVTISS